MKQEPEIEFDRQVSLGQFTELNVRHKLTILSMFSTVTLFFTDGLVMTQIISNTTIPSVLQIINIKILV